MEVQVEISQLVEVWHLIASSLSKGSHCLEQETTPVRRPTRRSEQRLQEFFERHGATAVLKKELKEDATDDSGR
ncbi:hypothetical protein BHS06_25950 [Myxococcus xanthus]|nr:hypothetical protein BHS06_25950 [Myxococcus xanthus]